MTPLENTRLSMDKSAFMKSVRGDEPNINIELQFKSCTDNIPKMLLKKLFLRLKFLICRKECLFYFGSISTTSIQYNIFIL